MRGARRRSGGSEGSDGRRVQREDGSGHRHGATRGRVLTAFAAIYLIWGSTYLAIRFAIETLPPFLMASTRFLVAGALLYGWMRLRGAPRPTAVHWRSTILVGGLLLLGGNGAVVWAQQVVPSGVAALLVAIVPVWMVLLEWARRGGHRPTGATVAGLVLGMAGLVLLVGPGQLAGAGRIHPVGAGVLVLGSLSWAAGSIYSRGARLPPSPFMAGGMEMLAGGALLGVAGLVTGERLTPLQASPASLLALLYLIVFGSLIGFTAYIWLLRVVPPARVATYAYVNPVVAVFLGWALASEPLTLRMLLAAAVIVAGVAIITTGALQISRLSPRPGPAGAPRPPPVGAPPSAAEAPRSLHGVAVSGYPPLPAPAERARDPAGRARPG
jgi:drug/metabolite transporter (DMT)-like permease